MILDNFIHSTSLMIYLLLEVLLTYIFQSIQQFSILYAFAIFNSKNNEPMLNGKLENICSEFKLLT